METFVQSQPIHVASRVAVKTKSKSKDEFWKMVEFNRFGISPTFLTIVVCLSAFAGAFAIQDSILAISLVGFPTAIFISSIIAIAPMRAIFALTGVTLLIDIAVILIHLIN
jgi:hypothetical protein